MPAPSHPGSNLFAIDREAVRRTLAEANARLLQRRDHLLAAFERAPQRFADADAMARGRRFAAQIEEILQQSRAARLTDGRAFNEVGADIRRFFEEIDRPLKVALQAVIERLTVAMESAGQSPGSSAGNAALATPPADPPPASGAVPLPAAPLLTVNPARPDPAEDGPAIELGWVVESVDRASLDLQALRPYLSDSVLLTACRKHLAEHGPHKVGGVAYARRARLA